MSLDPIKGESGHDVFVSYASPDAAVANSIVENLEQHGLKCWIAPRDVKPGAEYADAIVRAINDAKVIVLIMSAAAVASAHVGREVERAASKRKPIIAFRIDAASLSAALEYFMSQSQWIEVPKLGLPAALAKLKEAVGQGSPSVTQGIPDAPATRAIGKRIAIAAAVIIAGGVLATMSVRFWSSGHKSVPIATAITDKSIAVLPFLDMSEKKDQEYFSDGMSEELIDMLTKIPDLKVPARTSSFYFKGKATSITDIAKALSVFYVLEGSVRKSGTTLRITAQLIRADNGYHVWSETYDRNLGEVFKVQDEIAGEVIKVLKLKLFDGEVPHANATGNVEAYALRLQARFFRNRGQMGDTERTVDLYQQAVQLDPDSAVAWAELSDALRYSSASAGIIPWNVGREVALHAANRALALDPNLAQAHDAVAWIRYVDWDWTGAQAACDRARAVDRTFESSLAPQLAEALGDLSKAATLQERIAMRDPVNKLSYLRLAYIYIRQGRLSEAEAVARKAQELSPSGVGVPRTLGEILVRRGEAQAGLAEIGRDPDPGNRDFLLAWAYQYLGRKTDADIAFSHLMATGADDIPAEVAEIYAMRGELDLAFHWLERSYQKRTGGILYILDQPDLNNLRADPRWKPLLRKMNLPE
jgi:TolB-like protein/cytochrome c-type biogenesis protein CcmH/NrfG